MRKGDYRVIDSQFSPDFNDRLVRQFLAAENQPGVRKTHFFNGRFENIYLDEAQLPILAELKDEARSQAEAILGRAVRRMGCWCNAMGPGSETTLHSHDDDDEALSGVYYARVPEHAGKLLIHRGTEIIEHAARAGQWVFFSPGTPHAVAVNRSGELRLSIAFNFS